jgi:hypothetical protein
MRLPTGLLCLLLALALLSPPAAAAVLPQVPVLKTLLAADFDDKPVGAPIGTGGAEAGEPIALGNLDTEVIDLGGGNRALRVSNDLSVTNARRLRFGLGDAAEVDEGMLVLSFRFRTSALDRYSVLVREAGGSSRNFLALEFDNLGNLRMGSAAESNVLLGTYEAATDYLFRLVFDLEERTVSVLRNNDALAVSRPVGVADRGVGGLLIGYLSSSSGSAFRLDEVRARRLVDDSGFVPVLDASFNDKPLGQPLAPGGPDLGEPTQIDPSLSTEIVALDEGGRGLQVSGPVQPFTQVLRFGLLDAIEVDRGLVVIDIDFRTPTLDRYLLRLRESGGAARDFLSLRLEESGVVSGSDAAGSLGNLGQYQVDQRHRFRLVLDMDRRELDIGLDGFFLREIRRHGVLQRGVGGIIAGLFDFPLSGGPFVLGSVQVRAERALEIPAAAAFVQQPSDVLPGAAMQPAVEVAVVNLADDPVPAAVAVELSIVSGPAGASLQGGSTITADGVASFPALQLDLPGVYTLRATAGRVSAVSAAFEVSALPEAVFANGFE